MRKPGKKQQEVINYLLTKKPFYMATKAQLIDGYNAPFAGYYEREATPIIKNMVERGILLEDKNFFYKLAEYYIN